MPQMSERATPVSPVVADPSRLAALRRAALLDTPAEEGFDRLTRMGARMLDAPVALVSLVDEDRQFFKSQCGLPEPWASRRGTPLSHSFCQHAVSSRAPLVIEDAREHPLVRDNLAIRDIGVIAYLGVPLITSEGYELGSFCVIDTAPRRWAPEEVELVRGLARSVLAEIELRVASRELAQARSMLGRAARPEAPLAPGNKWKRDEVRLARIRDMAERASAQVSAGTASLVDVAFHPREVLWLARKVAQLRSAVARQGHGEE